MKNNPASLTDNFISVFFYCISEESLLVLGVSVTSSDFQFCIKIISVHMTEIYNNIDGVIL